MSPLFHDETALPHGPRMSVRASIPVELEWAMAAAEREDYRRDRPVLAAVYERDPALRARVSGLWGPDEASTCCGFLELLVLAHHGQLLFSTDAEAFLDRLPLLCTGTPADDRPALLSETDDDRRAVIHRLARLRRSPRLRRDYVAVVRDVWQVVRDEWERHGRASVEAAVGARRALLAKGADWHEVSRGDCDFSEGLARCIAALPADGELVVVPAFFTHRGLLVDLPGVVVVGVRTDTTGAQARARTDALARRLKAISDPTRLAILHSLRDGPRSVTEIAASFALAQPTVSNHVKVLRDVGLVTDVRDGTRRNIVVQPDAVDNLLANVTEVLTVPSS